MLLPGVTGEVVRLKVRVWPPLSTFCLVLPTLYLSLSSYFSSFIPFSLCLYISHFLSLPLPLSLSHSISVSIHSSIHLRIYPPLLSFSISHSLSPCLPLSLSTSLSPFISWRVPKQKEIISRRLGGESGAIGKTVAWYQVSILLSSRKMETRREGESLGKGIVLLLW